MLNALKAEFLKLVTVRSTYFVLGFALLLEFIFAFWSNGYRVDPLLTKNTGFLQSQITDAVGALALIGSLVGVLQTTHEYRYNTIMNTLTASGSRFKILAAKFLTLTVFALLFTAFMATLSPLLVLLGAHLGHHSISSQHIYFQDVVWQVLFYGWGYMMFGFVVALLIRNQVGSFATILLLPGLINQLLGMLLKANDKYLPFTALDAVIHHNAGLSTSKAAGVFLIYLAVGGVVALILFQKRDGN